MKNNFIDVICVTLDSDDKLIYLIESFKKWNNGLANLIIKDGMSGSSTRKIFDIYKSDPNIFIFSWPDSNISDAFNQGLTFSESDYVMFMGDGDTFNTKLNLREVIKRQNWINYDVIACRVNRLSIDGKVLHVYKTNYQLWKIMLHYKMVFPHQGLIMRRELFQIYGWFNLRCKYAMDYEYLLRIDWRSTSLLASDYVISYWLEDGIGSNDTLEVLSEYETIRESTGYSSWVVNKICTTIARIKYYYE